MGVTLLERGEYEVAMNTPSSSLSQIDAHKITQSLQKALEGNGPSRRLTQATTLGARFLGSGQYGYVQIVYLLEQPTLEVARQAITATIDELAGIQIQWRDFLPHISLATVDIDSAEDSLLKRFERFMPTTLDLMPLRVS
jgi:hypothetical protein